MDPVEMDDCLADVSKPINVYSLFFSSMEFNFVPISIRNAPE